MRRTIVAAVLALALGLGVGVGVVGAAVQYERQPTTYLAAQPNRITNPGGPLRWIGNQPMEAGVPITFEAPAYVTGREGSEALVVNITVVYPEADGYVTAWEPGVPQPVVSNVNYTAGQVTTNLAIVPCNESDMISIVTSTDATVIVDLFGVMDRGDG